MAAAETLTWDIAPARRPSLEDVGGAACLDDTSKPPPRDGSHLYANLVNQLQRQVQAMAKMVPAARITILNPAGTPTLNLLESPGSTLVGADFTITTGGTGIVNISWTAGKLPPVGTGPTGSVVYQSGSALGFGAIQSSATSIQVRTTEAGALANLPFVVAIH